MSERRLSDDDLRTAWGAADDGGTATLDREPPHPASGCPDPERIWAAVHGELGPAETREVVDHTIACPACAEAWRLARHLGAATAGVAAAPLRPARAAAARSAGSRPWWLAAVAAALVATLGIGFRQLWAPDTVTFRGGEAATVRPLVADGAELPRDRFELAWESVPAAVEYDLRLTTADLMTVEMRRGLEQPRYRVEPERLAALDDGSRLFWQVEVALASGDREVSPTFEVVLAAAAGGGTDRSSTGGARPPP